MRINTLKSNAKILRLKPANLRREKILEAAAEVFAQKGIERTTIDEIAAKAGVGKGTIYRRAGKKNDIINLLFKEAVCLAIDSMKIQIQKRTDPLLQFKEAVGALCDLYERHLSLMEMASCQLAICISEQERSKEASALRNKVSQLFGLVEKIFQKAVKKGQIRSIDTAAITKGFFNFLDPSYYQFLRSDRNYTKSEIVQLTIDLFLNGLKNKK